MRRTRTDRVADRRRYLESILALKAVTSPTAKTWAHLVERIARAEIRIEELEAQVAAVTKHVTWVPSIGVTRTGDLDLDAPTPSERLLAGGHAVRNTSRAKRTKPSRSKKS